MSLDKSLVNREIIAPKYLTASHLPLFIDACESVFKLANQYEEGFVLNLRKVEKASVIGVLVIYKLIDFFMTHGCFRAPVLLAEVGVLQAFKKYGFEELIVTYIKDRSKVEKKFKELKVSVGENFIIAPQALLRGDTINTNSINKKYLPQIEEYYSFTPKGISMIMLCLSEVVLNFWEHAIDDTKSIIVASGNKENIEIACADTGDGIISTLGKEFSNKSLSHEAILRKSLEKGVTSKEFTNHMGYGLWILHQIVKLTNGRMHLYSQGALYRLDNGREELRTSGYWQGTIIYISLPLKSPKTLIDIEEIERLSTKKELKINWQ